MNLITRLRCAYFGLTLSFLIYALVNFLWEIWNEQVRYNAIWVSLSFERQWMANVQLIGQDFLLLFTVFLIILFVKLELSKEKKEESKHGI